MKHIVIDNRESGTSTGRYSDKLVEYLHRFKPDYQITVLAKPHRVEALKKLAPGFTIVECDIKEFTFAEQTKLLWQIKKLKPDLVHFTLAHQPILLPGRVVTTMQDLTTVRFRNPSKNWFIFTFKQQVYKMVNIWVGKKSRLLITPTEFVKQDVAHYCHIKPAKVTVTLEASDKITESAQPVLLVGNKRFLFYIGRPMTHKNLERLVQAFVEVQKTHPNLYLVLGGKIDAVFRQLQKFSGKLTDHVIYTDFVSEGQLRWLYEQADAYVFPSLSEGFGLPGLEAMHYDLPVISSNATCLPEVYKDAALYFDPLDVKDMAAKISQVLDDDKLAAELAKKGQALVKTYSWQRMAQQTLDVYKKALGD